MVVTADWTDGYVTAVGFSHGYRPELNPLRMRLAFVRAGLKVPPITTACELGYGQGVSLGIHAAASLAQWYGTDINPTHADSARELVEASGTGARLYNDSFADFASRSDLPDFDYIGLGGVWSWISEQNRTVIVDFIRRRLKVGGILYVSYNSLLGWAAIAPLRHLFTEHADIVGTNKLGIVDRIDGALKFAARLLATKPGYSQDNPQVAAFFAYLNKGSRTDLAHEFWNRDWHPMHFATTSRLLASANLSYVCSAAYSDNIDALRLTNEQQTLMAEISDPGFRETTRDFMVNPTFRRDYWVRGASKLSTSDWEQTVRDERVALVKHQPDLPFKVRAILALNKTGPREDICTAILTMLADHRNMALGQIEESLKEKDTTLAQMLEAVTLLVGYHYVEPAQDDSVVQRVRKQTDSLNAHLIGKACGSGDIRHLASPITGGGIGVGRCEQLFLGALRRGKAQSDQWAQEAWQVLASEGYKGVKDGKTLETAEENIIDLMARARAFDLTGLPILKSLQVT